MPANALYERRWETVGLSFRPQENAFDLEMPPFSLPNIRASARVDGAEVSQGVQWTLTEESRDRTLFQRSDEFGTWELSFAMAPSGSAEGLTIALSLDPACDVRMIDFQPVAMTGTLPADHLLIHGMKMGGCEAVPLPVASPHPFESCFQTVITRDGCSLQIEHPLLQDHPSRVGGEARGGGIDRLTVTTRVSSGDTRHGIRSEPVTFRCSSRPHRLMVEWADRNRGSEKTLAPAKPGWNSWDYYRWTVTEDSVLENAEFIAADPVLSRHVKRIIVDDGWQYCYGEWDANPLFPSGMESLADHLTGMGFEPGLWLAPTIVEPHCRIAQLETDMLAMGESGLPCLAYECMRRQGFVLDPTVEQARTWLYNLFQRSARLGYRYFKLDFLSQTLKAPRFHDESVPRGHIMRRVVTPIREATRGRAELLGCNYPFEGGTDLVDAVRVSGDIHANWDAVCRNVHSVAARFWSNGRLWRNDPDFALCRGRETARDPDLHRLKPCLVFVPPTGTLPSTPAPLDSSLVSNTLEEAKVLLSIAVVSGGMINLSDKMTALNETGLDLARRTVAAKPGPAGIPLDLFETDKPSQWRQQLDDGGIRVLLINWSDGERTVTVDLEEQGIGRSRAVDFWTDAPVPVRNGRIDAELPPHSCLMAEL